MNSQSIQLIKIIVIICMSIWTLAAMLISHLYISKKTAASNINKCLLIAWWILLVMGLTAYLLHSHNYSPDPNRMLDMNTDEAIIFYAVFPVTAPFLWAYIIFMAFVPVKLIINLFKRPNENETIWVKNIFTYILLLIIAGIIYLLYYIIVEKIDINQWHSIFVMVIFCSLIVFSNISGFIYSIKKVNRTIILSVYFGMMVISTLLVQTLINIAVNILIKNNVFAECSVILFYGILIIVENIVSIIVIKVLLNKIPDNVALKGE